MNNAYILVGWWGGTCRTVLDELAMSQVAVAEDKGGHDVAGNRPVRRSRHWVGQSNDCGYGRTGVYGQEINVGVAVNMGDDSEGVVIGCRCGCQSTWRVSMWQVSIYRAVVRCCSWALACIRDFPVA